MTVTTVVPGVVVTTVADGVTVVSRSTTRLTQPVVAATAARKQTLAAKAFIVDTSEGIPSNDAASEDRPRDQW
ncbi:MAG: hypothetical protein AUI04_05475 [Candidatus Rokubacteria bacterium 13_2_20CM_2_64_8]|nr:MAG: hypothetical protein AUI04_05475 [Candidatus Rokubacteria bacterium 13_2_20CM_2_64_8]OLE00894.1 MAG: hypothetical protein AUG80_01110 [Candidatus Rokubacteria bacterium 13_1_20CM_4_68_9]